MLLKVLKETGQVRGLHCNNMVLVICVSASLEKVPVRMHFLFESGIF
jgi:hypothetical protein